MTDPSPYSVTICDGASYPVCKIHDHQPFQMNIFNEFPTDTAQIYIAAARPTTSCFDRTDNPCNEAESSYNSTLDT